MKKNLPQRYFVMATPHRGVLYPLLIQLDPRPRVLRTETCPFAHPAAAAKCSRYEYRTRPRRDWFEARGPTVIQGGGWRPRKSLSASSSRCAADPCRCSAPVSFDRGHHRHQLPAMSGSASFFRLGESKTSNRSIVDGWHSLYPVYLDVEELRYALYIGPITLIPTHRHPSSVNPLISAVLFFHPPPLSLDAGSGRLRTGTVLVTC